MSDSLKNKTPFSKWRVAAVAVTCLSLLVGLIFTHMTLFHVLFVTILPLHMVLAPWIWVGMVPRRYSYSLEGVTEEFVIVCGWWGIVGGLLSVLITASLQ